MLLALCLTALIQGPFDPGAFDTVFGARIGVDRPRVLESRFGSESRVTRHYWSEKWKRYIRDDGWNWWSWPTAKADVQMGWEPAYPVSKRRIVSFWMTESTSHGEAASISPSTKLAGWLNGIDIGMSRERCLALLRSRFGPSKTEFSEFVWLSKRAKLSVYFDKGELKELTVSKL
jgi:hypothetical protein